MCYGNSLGDALDMCLDFPKKSPFPPFGGEIKNSNHKIKKSVCLQEKQGLFLEKVHS